MASQKVQQLAIQPWRPTSDLRLIDFGHMPRRYAFFGGGAPFGLDLQFLSFQGHFGRRRGFRILSGLLVPWRGPKNAKDGL